MFESAYLFVGSEVNLSLTQIIYSFFPPIDPSNPFTLEVILALAFWFIWGLALETTHLIPKLHRIFDAIVLIVIALIALYFFIAILPDISTGTLRPERIQALLFRVAPYTIPFFLGIGIASLVVRRQK